MHWLRLCISLSGQSASDTVGAVERSSRDRWEAWRSRASDLHGSGFDQASSPARSTRSSGSDPTGVSALLGKGRLDCPAALRQTRRVLRPIGVSVWRLLMMSGSHSGMVTLHASHTYPLLSCAMREHAPPARATDPRLRSPCFRKVRSQHQSKWKNLKTH